MCIKIVQFVYSHLNVCYCRNNNGIIIKRLFSDMYLILHKKKTKNKAAFSARICCSVNDPQVVGLLRHLVVSVGSAGLISASFW